MDKLTLLCSQELMDDLMNTASSSDEDEEKQQKMDVLTLICAQNLLESSSSSDDDEFFEMLAYAHLLRRSEKLSKYKEQIHKAEVNDSSLQNGEYYARKYNKSSTVFKTSTNKAKETNFEKVNRNEDTENDKILSACNLPPTLDEANIDSFSENYFKQQFHVNRTTLTYLIDRFSAWYSKGSYEHCGLKLNIKITMLIFLRFCAKPDSFENVTRIFNTSLMDSKVSLNLILDFFASELASEVIKYPTSHTEKELIAKDFEKIAGFPNVLGCLTVSHFSLKTPELIEICGGPQVSLRGICDSKQKFLSIKIAVAKTSENDAFLEKHLSKLCFPKYHMLGDATCLIRDHLVIPYENTENLSESEELFNAKLARTHFKIKEAFGNLRKRFCQLQYLDFNDIETLTKFITACCILHNICIDRQDVYDDAYTTEPCRQLDDVACTVVQADDFLTDLGLMKRYELTQILFRTNK